MELKVTARSYQDIQTSCFQPANEYNPEILPIIRYMSPATKITPLTGEAWNNKYAGNNSRCLSPMPLIYCWNGAEMIGERKEINRNNAVYKLQGKLKPIVDFPILSEYVGKHTDLAKRR